MCKGVHAANRIAFITTGICFVVEERIVCPGSQTKGTDKNTKNDRNVCSKKSNKIKVSGSSFSPIKHLSLGPSHQRQMCILSLSLSNFTEHGQAREVCVCLVCVCVYTYTHNK